MSRNKTKTFKKVEVEVSNPFDKGVTYKSFLEELGEKSVKEVLKDRCSDAQIKWIEIELEHYKQNNK